MKTLVVAWSLITLFCLLLASTAENAPKRQKRTLSHETCPQNTTKEQCLDYIEEKSKNLKDCHTVILHDTNIEWQFCGSFYCGENGKLIPVDPSKPYPDCCGFCEVIDESKPYIFYGAL